MNRRAAHPIEVRSFELLAERVSLDGLGPASRAVAARVVHATADPAWVGDLVLDEAALQAGLGALGTGAVIVADVRMTAAGITGADCLCALDYAPACAPPGSTRSAAGMLAATRAAGAGAVWVVGCAPTALAAVLSATGQPTSPLPALVVGLPVGFVGAVQAKCALRASALPALSNRSERGGAAAAAAAVNALRYLAAGSR